MSDILKKSIINGRNLVWLVSAPVSIAMIVAI